MKKILFVLSIVGASVVAHAQLPKFGLKAGVNFANISNTDNTTTMKTGFHGGIYASIPLGVFSITPEVMYSGEGAKLKGSSDNLSLNYLNIPVMFQFNTPVGVFVETGPQYGLLLSANLNQNGTNSDVKESFKTSNFSWALGAGYKIPVIGLGLGVRYALGLSGLDKDVTGSDASKTRTLQLSVSKSF